MKKNNQPPKSPIDFLAQPILRFMQLETAASMILLGVTCIAFYLANSHFSAWYFQVFDHKLTLGLGDFALSKPLFLWINDFLMAIFFLLIGLEVKRELLIGELDSLKKANLPFMAAVGGMLLPALLYVYLNDNPEATAGWAIPTATDIAFSLGVIKLLGNRVSHSVKVFLTAFAIVDDIGATLIIALFYSGHIQWELIAYSGIGIGILALLCVKGIYSQVALVVIGLGVWLLFLKSGIHPTVAGVILGFCVPLRRKIDAGGLLKAIKNSSDKLLDIFDKPPQDILSHQQLEKVRSMEISLERLHSPLQHLEDKLHGFVAYFILPVFAFANAGITVTGDSIIDTSLANNIGLSLIFGKIIGISFFTYLAIKLGIAEKPDWFCFSTIIGVAALGGIGFTMSIFVTNLAFDQAVLKDSAKLGVLIGSVIAAVSGYGFLLLASIMRNKKA